MTTFEVLRLDEAWILRTADLALGPNLCTSFTVHARDPATKRSIDSVVVAIVTGPTSGRLIFAAPPAPPIDLVTTPQPGGGLRWWFGGAHGDRFSTLVRPAGETRFAPRKAWGATSYPSQRTGPRRRAAARAARLRLALGGSPDIEASLPPKPPGMHVERYERIAADIAAFSTKALDGRALASVTNKETTP